MNAEPMEIKLKENYVPKTATVAIRVAFFRREEELKEIRKLESEVIIEPIGDRPTEFCSPTICPIKPDGSIRFAADYTHLNNAGAKNGPSYIVTLGCCTSDRQKGKVLLKV